MRETKNGREGTVSDELLRPSVKDVLVKSQCCITPHPFVTDYKSFLQFLAIAVLVAVASAAEKKEDLKTEESHPVASYGSG